MSTAAINPKGPRVYPAGNTPTAWGKTYLASSVGQKLLVAATGVLLVGFLVFHMIGNLKVLPGFEAPGEEAVKHATAKAAEKFPDDSAAQSKYVEEHLRSFEAQEHINKYAAFLKHDLGALIWIARGGLLVLFLTHLTIALRLRAKSGEARPIGYTVKRTAQATTAAKTMLWTGIVILLFAVFHLAHYTFCWVHTANVNGTATSYLSLHDGEGRHDVYSMVIAGFTEPWVCVIYILSQALLLVHLSHGIQSSLQTLGLVGKRFTPAAKWLGWCTAAAIFAGNLTIVMGVWLGWAKPVI